MNTNSTKSLIIFLLAIAGIIAAILGSIPLSNWSAGIIAEWLAPDHSERWQYLITGFALAFSFFFIGWLVDYVLSYSGQFVRKSTKQLKEETDNLKTTVTETNEKLGLAADKLKTAVTETDEKLGSAADRLTTLLEGQDGEPGLLSGAENILKVQKRINHIDQIVLLEKFDALQDRFIEVANIAELIKKSPVDLRIVGTMLGTYGRSGLGLADHMVKLSERANKQPFSEAFFGVPGHASSQEIGGEGLRSLYPFSARIAAGDILLDLAKHWGDDLKHIDTEQLNIHISFVPREDIFPAIQLWGDNCAMVLCSTGTDDRTNFKKANKIKAITDAMPVALVLLDRYKLQGLEKECDLNRTLGRIKSHLQKDYLSSPQNEVWRISKVTRNIWVCNYQDLREEKEFLELAKPKVPDDHYKELLNGLNELRNNRVQHNLTDFARIIEILSKTTSAILEG
uniref:Uncharacterized protein n=1 Tax=Candidatus Kentrum sp. DK TaxID=2126562 RepID=A0A450TJY6_9GAMM|nr:MAG: hypothetical protein BECKDK2373B_GA0170837_11964 [Candidatus Kentron sp. DK]